MNIKFDQNKFLDAKDKGNLATKNMRSASNKASSVKNPSSVPISINLSKAKELFSKADDIDTAYNEWETLAGQLDLPVSNLTETELFSILNDPSAMCTLDFDRNVMIVVTDGSESSGRIKYELPLDLYVVSVMDGEHLLIDYVAKWYTNTPIIKNGVSYLPTYDQLIEGFKAASIIIRSYTIAQTVDSDKHSIDMRINGSASGSKQVSTDRLIMGNHDYASGDTALQFGLKAAVETTGMVLATSDGKVVSAHFIARLLDRCMEYAMDGCDYQQSLTKAINDASTWGDGEGGLKFPEYANDVHISYWDSETKQVTGKVSADDKISKMIDKNLPDGVEVDENTIYSLDGSVADDLKKMQRDRKYREPKPLEEETVNLGNGTPSGGTAGSGYSSSTIGSTIDVNSNILPSNKFSDILPELKAGNLSSYEIDTNHVEYNIYNITDNEYNSYIDTLLKNGYRELEDGTGFIKENYKVLLERSDNNLLLSMYVIDNV